MMVKKGETPVDYDVVTWDDQSLEVYGTFTTSMPGAGGSPYGFQRSTIDGERGMVAFALNDRDQWILVFVNLQTNELARVNVPEEGARGFYDMGFTADDAFYLYYSDYLSDEEEEGILKLDPRELEYFAVDEDIWSPGPEEF
jgi:hypothetical protein